MSFRYDPAIAAKKARNVDVYQETMNICRVGGYDTANGYVDLPPLADVLAASKFYDNPSRVDGKPTVGTTVLDAVNADCIDVTRDLVAQGYNPIMLNMANRHTPGGGVLNGARAQEESLFRQSNLCVSLYQYSDYHAGLLGLAKGDGSYPMDRNTGGIYSGRVTFFRTSQRQGDKLVDTPFECAVVSVAAINRPDLDADGRLVNWAIEATQEKIRTMLRIGLHHGHDAIVLGAWGCGAFCNPPEHMAEIFRDVLNECEFANKFKIVRFAVIEDHNSRRSNYAPFDRVFNQEPACPVSRDDDAHLMVRGKVANLQNPGFPEKLTADMLKDFVTTERGCTHPRVGTIDGHRFIAKCGSWSAHSSDKHVHNEYVADNLLRAAGLNVPFSREYQVDFGDGLGFQTVRLAVYDDTLRPIMEVWEEADDVLKAKIREQTVAAYPVQALIAGIDTFTWDNVKVDLKGGLWFVDNGASFNYRACGKKKGWFWDREDIDAAATGYLSLAHHPHQGDLQEILGDTPDAELWAAAKNYRLRKLVRVLPDSHRRGALKSYAKAIDARALDASLVNLGGNSDGQIAVGNMI